MRDMKFYITKYALTDGIKEVEAPEPTDQETTLVLTGGRFTQYAHVEGLEWHRTKESAKKRAEIMREKRIASHKKQIEKLSKLEF